MGRTRYGETERETGRMRDMEKQRWGKGDMERQTERERWEEGDMKRQTER
jgi:hypothetical protein